MRKKVLYGKGGLKVKNKKGLSYKNELIGIFLIALFVFLGISLFSHSPTDRSLFYFSSSDKLISNWCGFVGAQISAILLFFFGASSYIFLFAILLSSLICFINNQFVRLSYLPFFVFISSCLLSVHGISTGGFIGNVFSRLFLNVFGKTGSLVVLYSVLFSSSLIATRISFLSILKFTLIISKKTLLLFYYLSSKLILLIRRSFLGLVSCRGGASIGISKKYVKKKVNKIKARSYKLSDLSFFDDQVKDRRNSARFFREANQRARKLEEKLLHFGIKGKVTAIKPGPVVTLFEYQPEIDSKISRIVSLEDDLSMALKALSIRIIAPIPGKSVVGFEISNKEKESVILSEVHKGLKDFSGSLPLTLGVDITGKPVIKDLIKMPHLLVAGSTGSGKSVGLNTFLISLLYRLSPDELKVILVDPKRLEFAPYSDIPHLLFPIVTTPNKAIPVLKWVVQEMEERYDIMAKVGARSIMDYHRLTKGKDGHKNMPFIVLIIDELADLMMVAGKDVETNIARVAQMARAAGIHMIIATQRPSVDVLTGIIKVNFPARVAFRVSSKIDSRTIIDSTGAEKLLGAGDMLFLDSASSSTKRIHGAYISSENILKFTDKLRAQGAAEYLDINEVLKDSKSFSQEKFEDDLYEEIKSFVKTLDVVSISMLQRKYRIGFNRSARIVEYLERDGIISSQSSGKMRKVV